MPLQSSAPPAGHTSNENRSFECPQPIRGVERLRLPLAEGRGYRSSAYRRDSFIGDEWLGRISNDSFKPYIDVMKRRKRPLVAGTVNRRIGVARRVLNLSARLWRDREDLPRSPCSVWRVSGKCLI